MRKHGNIKINLKGININKNRKTFGLYVAVAEPRNINYAVAVNVETLLLSERMTEHVMLCHHLR